MEKTEERFKTLIETIPHGIVEVSVEGNIGYCNKSFCGILGYEKEEVMGMCFVDFAADDETEKKIAEILKSNDCNCPSISCKNRLMNKDGRVMDFQADWSKKFDERGNINGYVSVFVDITDRNLESHEITHALLNAPEDPVFLTDCEGKILALNEIAAQRLGRGVDELIGVCAYDLFPADLAKLMKEQDCKVIRSGKPVRFEDTHRGRIYDNHVYPVFDKEKRVTGLAIFAKEITEYRRTEESHRESEERFRSLIESSPIGISIMRDEGDILYCNPAYMRMYGYSDMDEMVSTDFEGRIAPQSLGGILDRVRRRKGNEELLPSHEYLALRKDGTQFPVHAELSSINLSDGPATIAFITDISERKRAEEELRDGEEKYRKLVEMSPDAILIHEGGNVEFVNQPGLRMFGWRGPEDGEYLGRNIIEFVHPDSKELAIARYKELINEDEATPIVEMRFLQFSGESFYGEITSIPFAYMGKRRVMIIIHDVTQRKKVEEALRDSEEKYRDVVERANDAIVIIQDGNLTYINPRGAAILGYRPEEVIGTSMINHVHPDFAGEALERIRKRMEGEGISDLYEVVLRHKDGSVRYVEMSGGVIQYGGMPADLIVGRDITERKEAEEALQKSEERYRLLADNSSDIIWTMDLNGNFTYMSPSVETLTGFSPDDVINNSLEYFMGNESASRIREIIGSIDPDKAIGELSVIGVELKQPTREGGVLDVEINSILTYGEDGNLTGIQGSSRDVTRRKAVEEALRESEEKHRELVENINEVIYAVDEWGTITYISPAVERLYGYDTSEIIGRNFLEFIHEDDRGRMREGFELSLKGNRRGNEYRLITKSGELRWFFTNFNVIFKEGKPSGLRGTLVDVTDRKQAEEALNNSEERFRSLIESSPLGILIVRDGELIYSNPAFNRMYGYDERDEFGETILMDRIAPECRDLIADRNRRRERGEDVPSAYEFIGLRKNGARFPVYIELSLIEMYDGVATIAYLLDITEQKKAEEALRDSEERYRRIFENIDDIYYEAAPDGTILEMSPSVEAIGGYTREEMIGSSAYEVYEMPADRVKLHEDRRNVGGHVSDYPLKLKRKDGSRVHCSLNARMVFDEFGNHVKNVGLIRDMSDRSLMEEALRESESKYRTLVENTIVGLILSQNGGVVFANPKVKEMLGYSDEEITLMSFEQFLVLDDREEIMHSREFWMKRPESLGSTDCRMLDRNGNEKWIEVKSIAIEWQGQPAVMSFLNDINARKIAEEELKYRIEFEDIITSIATQFVNLPSAEIDLCINQALETVGEFAGVDRIYIFLFSEDHLLMSKTHEWCAKGIKTKIKNQKNLVLDDYKWFSAKIKGTEILYLPRVSDITAKANSEIKKMKMEGVQSLIIVPMISKESPVGFLGMDSVKGERTWPDYIFNLLKILAEVFVNLLERRQKDDILNMYDNIISSTREQISYVDCNGVFQAVNDAFIDAFKMKRDEIIGHSLDEVFGRGMFRDNLREFYEQCLAGQEKKFDRWLNYPAIGQRYVEVSLYPFFNAGVVSGVILNLVDITDKVKIEKDILDIGSRERRKIGLDLHDELGHHLLGIAIKCRLLAEKLTDNSFREANDVFEIEELINKSINKTRSMAKGIFPINLEKFGLREMVKEIVENIGDVDVSFTINIDSSIEKCEIEILRHLYFIIEEAVLNAIKHSGATHVDISLIFDDYYFVLRIRDDGVGMPEVPDQGGGIGLSIMSYRARMISASLDISRPDGGGAEIICRFKA
jgi:PAS domain S-box-containing protein